MLIKYKTNAHKGVGDLLPLFGFFVFRVAVGGNPSPGPPSMCGHAPDSCDIYVSFGIFRCFLHLFVYSFICLSGSAFSVTFQSISWLRSGYLIKRQIYERVRTVKR